MHSGVALVITDPLGRLLLQLRSRGAQIGCWELPAGHVKTGEDEYGTAIREAREELGIEIEAMDELGVNVDNQLNFDCLIYRVTRYQGDPKNVDTRNHVELGWFPLAALPEPLGSSARRTTQLLP